MPVALPPLHRSSSRVLTALLLVAVSLPVTTQAVFRSQPTDPALRAAVQDVRPVARAAGIGAPLRRRAYTLAVREYRRRVREGDETAVMPDINDPSTYAAFLPGSSDATDTSIDTSDEDAEQTAVPADPAALNAGQRALLRRSVRARHCSTQLERSFAGLYALCVSLVGEDSATPPQHIGSVRQHLATESAPSAPTIQRRLEMLKQAMDRSTRRPDIVRPRPVPSLP